MTISYNSEAKRFESYTDLGCYPIFHLCKDGGVLCADCCNDPSNGAHIGNQHDPQWQIVASDVNWEDAHLHCDHCSKRIESAYAEDEEEDEEENEEEGVTQP